VGKLPVPLFLYTKSAMKILYAAFVRLPTEKAHGSQIVHTCDALARAGHDVTLMIPGRKLSLSGSPFAYYAVPESFTLVTLGTPDWVRRGWLGFVGSLVWFSEVIKFRREFWDADVVYSRDAGLLLQYILLGRKLVYEAHTAPTAISTFVARRAFRVVVISEGLRDAYVLRGISAEKIVVAHDAIDIDPFAVAYDRTTVRAEFGIPEDARVALYVGRVDAAKGVETLAAAQTLIPDWQVVIVGSGPLLATLKTAYPTVTYLPETPYRDIAKVLTLGDVLVAPNSAKDIDASVYTSPLKAFAYLATGKPILSSDVPALRTIFKDSASYFVPDDTKSVVQTLSAISLEREHVPAVYSWNERARAIVQHLRLR
jgi:glycosyltransferase involved in cell wall biosynthesis